MTDQQHRLALTKAGAEKQHIKVCGSCCHFNHIMVVHDVVPDDSI
jgi:acid stress-induced BolA-like protein IbaG/YrbA